MQIERVKLDGFGNLSGEFSFPPGRCAIVMAPNEAGKTTLAKAMLALLYGFQKKSDVLSKDEKKRHQGEDGGRLQHE